MEELERSTVETEGIAEPMQAWYENVTYEDAKIFIKSNIESAARSFIAIGYYLKAVRDHGMYREDGHASIWEFAQAEYGISKSTASRYMTMNDRFSKHGNSPVIADAYKDFGKSQLQEMLYLTDVQMEEAGPGLTLREIRKMKEPPAREMPYIPIPGQLDIRDFPGFSPEDTERAGEEVQTCKAGKEAYTIRAEELVEAVAAAQQNLFPIRQEAGQTQEEDARTAAGKPDAQEPGMQAQDHGPEDDGEMPETRETVVDSQKRQPELPVLKNNDQRAAFVDVYETWPLWIETEQTGERYYRYDLEDGTSMVVKVYLARLFAGFAEGSYESQYHEGYGRHEYYLLQPGKFFRDCDTNRSALIDKLKEIQKVKKGNGSGYKTNG